MPHIGGQILGSEFLRQSSLCSVEERPSATRQMVLFQLWLCSKKPKLKGELDSPWPQPGQSSGFMLKDQDPKGDPQLHLLTPLFRPGEQGLHSK